MLPEKNVSHSGSLRSTSILTEGGAMHPLESIVEAPCLLQLVVVAIGLWCSLACSCLTLVSAFVSILLVCLYPHLAVFL
jgi:hypothetical protein